MRILMAANGRSVHTVRWASLLAARGHQVAVAAENPCPVAGIATYRLAGVGRGRLGLPRVVRDLKRAIRAFEPDVLHAHYVSHYGLIAALTKRHPLVLSAWGADVEVFPRRHPINRAVLSWVLSQGDVVTATSHYLAGVVEGCMGRSGGCRVVPFGIDLELFSPPPEPPTAPPLRIVCNKHLEWVYGVDLLIDALARLPNTTPWEAVILGEGTERAALEARAQARQVAERVRFTGAIPPTAVRDVLRGAHLAVYPSRRESFGVATLEASAVGLPVVASRVGGLAEVVRDGVTGRLVAPDEVDALSGSMAQLLDAPAAARAMGAAGRRLVEDEYSEARAVALMEDAYERATGRP